MEAETETSSRNSRMKMKSRRKKDFKRCKEKVANILKDGNSECYDYLVRISKVIETVRDDSYEMEVLAANVFNEIKGNEVSYSKIKLTSRLLEDLLPHSNHNIYNQFIRNFTNDLRPVFTDRIASHVLQSITTETFKRFSQVFTKAKDKDRTLSQNYFDIIMKISKFALNNLETFIWERSSNHVIRTIFNVLNGYIVKEEIKDGDPKVVTPDEFQLLLEKFTQNIVNLPQFRELCNNSHTSGLLQVLLTASKQHDHICKHLIKKIIKDRKGEVHNFEDEQNEALLRLIESALVVANEKQLRKLYKTFIGRNLKSMSTSKIGNFAVQKLIKNCKDQELFDHVFDELQPGAESILEAKTTGVLLKLARGCVKLKTKQGEFVKMMMRILKCQKILNEDSDITPLCCSMVTSENYNPEEAKINLHGTLIIQAMLHFGKPIKIINSLLNMETKHVLQLFSDPRGCHIVDAFIESPTVGEKSRDKLFKKLLGSYTQLAMSKHGSRSLDALWNGITTKNKILLMEELKSNESDLISSQFGKFFVRNSNLYNFCRHREEWIKRENLLENTKKCFSDIIPCKKPKFQP